MNIKANYVLKIVKKLENVCTPLELPIQYLFPF
jgi:hypothetical protein